MSEIMRPMPFGKLMNWALSEYAQQQRIFGIRAEKFYRSPNDSRFSLFGAPLASPIGPAAGPNSQLAQNIVAAWLAGSRFIELKTVQKMDGAELRACVPRPCINAEDEGYNVEWSTELTVPQAFEEYAKAWLAVHALAKELDIPGGTDLAFNMSVGYDLEGIRGEKIDHFLESMKDASRTPVFQEAQAWLRDNLGRFSRLSVADIDAIPSTVSHSVTLSTLHGCPPEEIERIAKYLLEEKGLHTFVKCNPTLLGYETARALLDEMGYGYISFDEHHFQNDLQFADAVAMLRRLLAYAGERKLAFGVKLTNTFPVQIQKKELPGEEMYMSGRPLLPLSLHVAAKLAGEFGEALPISYSGGADAFNLTELLEAGIRPVTVATTILKPGGYERIKQLAELAAPLLGRPGGVDAAKTAALAQQVVNNPLYRKEHRPVASRKTRTSLPLFDCFKAPCRQGGCPIEQRVPEYLRLVAEEKYDEAFRVIAADNATPSITGEICNHACQGKCTRLDYDESLHIRNAKRLAAVAAQQRFTGALVPPPLQTNKRAVVVGAGPAGVAAALFLRRAGMAVTVLEKRDKPFGIVEYIIPAFRISREALKRDFEMAKATGVEFHFNTEARDIAALRAEYDYVVLAVGAWKESAPAVQEGGDKVIDALAFLAESRAKDCQVPLGRRVAVIGGGDVAMDCARAARRAPGTEQVTLVYRRTRDFMPAEPEEIRLALEDGVELVELRAPLNYDGASLCCEETCLCGWDETGRRAVKGTGVHHHLEFDSVICATGARVDDTLFAAAGLRQDDRGRPILSAANESSLPGVYVTGDCRRGSSTVVQAVADAKAAARDILAKLGLDDGFGLVPAATPLAEDTLYGRKGVLALGSNTPGDGTRCLACDTLCELCCDVCPNRANVRIPVALEGCSDPHQILHLDAQCNECGNCGTFCPHTGNPYKDKVTLFTTEEDLRDSENTGFLKTGSTSFIIRVNGEVFTAEAGDTRIPAQMAALIEAVERDYAYYL